MSKITVCRINKIHLCNTGLILKVDLDTWPAVFIIVIVPKLIVLFLICSGVLYAQDNFHKKIYKKVHTSVVGIRCMMPVLGEKSGTGIILDKSGFILTSYAVVPEGSTNIRIYLKGARIISAKIVATSKEDEITLLKVNPKKYKLKPIEFANSDKVKIGQIAYTIGNASNSIINDDAPSLSVGIISGIYTLRKTYGDATYVGPVFETTAAVNPGMEGAPVINMQGKVIGIVTLNFSPARWLGNCIPSNFVKMRVNLLKKIKPQDNKNNKQPEKPGYLGIEVEQKDNKVVVKKVKKGSPAYKAGIMKGDIILEIARLKIKTVQEFKRALSKLKCGDLVIIKIKCADGEQIELKVVLEAEK
jgi:S1-C subfamily serine protease